MCSVVRPKNRFYVDLIAVWIVFHPTFDLRHPSTELDDVVFFLLSIVPLKSLDYHFFFNRDPSNTDEIYEIT